MRFEVVQPFNAPVEVVETALVDPQFLEALSDLQELGRPELLEQHHDGDRVRQRVRYAFTGNLSSAARAVIDPAKLTWVEETVQDRGTHTSTVTIVPDYYAGIFSSDASVRLEAGSDPGTSIRTTTGEVKVRVPLVGRRVEAAIISGLPDHAEQEAKLLERWVAEHR